MIFQDYALFPHLNVADNIAFGLQKIAQSQQGDIVQEMLRLVKLQGYGDRFPHELSGGQQQRVAIARALAYKPQLMLLDEPFSNIDSQSRGEIMQEMRQILKAQGVPALFVTHSKDEAFAFADKIAIFSEGKIEQIDQGSVLYAEPSSPYVANFMGKTNYLTIDSVSDKGLETALGTIPVDADPLIDSHNVVMLRPEQLVIDEHSSCKFTVVQSVFAGSHWIYNVSGVADQEVIVEVHSHAMLELEQVIGLTVLPHKSVTFNINK
jgi:iron(III) transport system ATP-binding protein